jgi:hypothetical protein
VQHTNKKQKRKQIKEENFMKKLVLGMMMLTVTSFANTGKIINPYKYTKATIFITADAWKKDKDGVTDSTSTDVCRLELEVPNYDGVVSKVKSSPTDSVSNMNDDVQLSNPREKLPSDIGCKVNQPGVGEVLVSFQLFIEKAKIRSLSKSMSFLAGDYQFYGAFMEVYPPGATFKYDRNARGGQVVDEQSDNIKEENMKVYQFGNANATVESPNKKAILSIDSDLRDVCSQRSAEFGFKDTTACQESNLVRYSATVVFHE